MTASTCGQSLRRPVWFAGGSRRIRTIFALRRLAAWDKRSVTSLPYRCVEDIIANCTAQAMRWHGGAARGSTQHRRPARSGSKAIRCPASTAATQLHRTITVSPQISRAGTLQGHSNIPSRNHDLPSGHFTPLCSLSATRLNHFTPLQWRQVTFPRQHRRFPNSAKRVSASVTGNVTENELVCDAKFASGDALLWPDAANQVRSTPVSTTRGRLAA